MIKKFWPVLFLIAISLIFFGQTILKGYLPIPADTIAGLYYPFRDFYAKDYPRGVPFKNFMITDPVRQQYPWKSLAIEIEKKFELPLWNPYTFSGQPLMANIQSGGFYPINLLFFIVPFSYAWSLYIFLQPVLASIFLFLYLRNLGLTKISSIFGSISFSFGGFFISWLEWGAVLHTALWLPLILLSIDKLTVAKDKALIKWSFIMALSLTFSFLAGHLQVFFYSFVLSIFYFLFRIPKTIKKNYIVSGLFALFFLIVFSFPAWYESFKFISLSGRVLDQDWRTIAGWFIPWQNSVQIIIPDFFGNPATLNYYGVWNYGEFISYIGIGSFIFALFSVFRKDKITLFFLLTTLIAALFAFPNLVAKIPFKFEIPLFSTSQPTRLIFIIDFSLSILAALGFDYFLSAKDKKKIAYPVAILFFVFSFIWIFVFLNLKTNPSQNLLVSKSNLILPTLLFIINSIVILFMFAYKKNQRIFYALSVLIFVILTLDLLRFGSKYTPFTDSKYLYPQTKVISFLKKNLGNYRIMATDSRIFPPNFSIIYKIQSIDGYDPLYLQNYAEFSAALERGSPDIHAPFGFNRIITPQNYHSRIIDLLGVKYVLTFEDLDKRNFTKVFQEGITKIYLNKNVLPRAFFVNSTHKSEGKQDSINYIFSNQYNLDSTAVVDGNIKNNLTKNKYSTVLIKNYSENSVSLETQNPGNGFLVFTDNFYPTWKATIDGKPTKIYLTDYSFRGIEVPKGKHKILFYNTF